MDNLILVIVDDNFTDNPPLVRQFATYHNALQWLTKNYNTYLEQKIFNFSMPKSIREQVKYNVIRKGYNKVVYPNGNIITWKTANLPNEIL